MGGHSNNGTVSNGAPNHHQEQRGCNFQCTVGTAGAASARGGVGAARQTVDRSTFFAAQDEPPVMPNG
ncbi:hypothetical protein [Streptomyces sp. CBMA29]|uniref:hypothetical protein n=1 Tax=Streptomyces sp. CBMA29 TaxID=1896314 RepID=UPI001661B321|nr:hypothetical protein [Streptomyces sp. CBMA29]MBD0736452.1 hypothetical protein [Streptomyces sp. CBMA29]